MCPCRYRRCSELATRGVSEEDESIKDVLLATTLAMVIELCVEAWTEDLERATQENMPLELLKEIR